MSRKVFSGALAPEHELRRENAELKLRVQQLQVENMRLESLMVEENEVIRHVVAFERFVLGVSQQMVTGDHTAELHRGNVDTAKQLYQLAKFVRTVKDRCRALPMPIALQHHCLLRNGHPGRHVALAGNWDEKPRVPAPPRAPPPRSPRPPPTAAEIARLTAISAAPVCAEPRCLGPMVPIASADGFNHRASSEHRLVCIGCGRGRVGTDAELAAAVAVDQLSGDADRRRAS